MVLILLLKSSSSLPRGLVHGRNLVSDTTNDEALLRGWDTGPSLLLLPQKYEDRRQPVAASGGSVSENSPFLVPNQVPSPDPRSPDQFGFGSNHSTWSETWWG